jgi:hypothetical protein
MKEKMEQAIDCARAEDLVAYLYGEASEQEAAEFRRHMEQCGSCSSELTAFSRVREDVVEWRNQSLPSFEFSQTSAPVFREAIETTRKRSALAAVREFFTLAPLWMRTASALAALAICALVVFTVIHFTEKPGTIVRLDSPAPTEAQAEDTLKRRADEIRQQEVTKAQEKPAPIATEKPSVTSARDNKAVARTKFRRATVSTPTLAKKNSKTLDKVKASQEARQQLAELVQISKDDDGLPRLSDLIEDSNGSN